ncbi:hypothetical protein B0T16DRAFT_186983 [Cercophora newfieldiana]|uniref:F-box domain-containing protein n=1 Tax=Cercophora newfieldiana TaxID=92897 RepID=A0AA40CMA6_9PEZI|nr:hypothetical protein B0T16DRAFT_186983 [Cercophora newfieldiana]
MVHITQLPAEILHNILGFVDPSDLGTLPRTCRYLYGFVTGNSALCRDIYYRTLDEPPSSDINWEQELHDLVQLQRICSVEYGTDKRASLPFVYNTVTRLLRNASKSTPNTSRVIHSLTYPSSRNTSILTTLLTPTSLSPFLTSSFLFSRARGTSPPTIPLSPLAHHQQSAHLHCLYGSPILKHGRTRSSSMYPFACSKVYDLREYTDGSMWGPFWNDGSGRVDWEKVEAILMVVGGNIRGKGLEGFPVFENFWGRGWGGSWEGSYIPWPGVQAQEEEGDAEGEGSDGGDAEGENRDGEGSGGKEHIRSLRERDPFGVSGTWLRVVCFLDYNDFFNYNFPVADEIPANVPRPALDVGEAIRLILMKIHVTKIEQSETDSPIVHFKGFSRSLDGSWDDNANSDLRGWYLRGTAQYTPEGEVRWTTYSIFSGEERWKSEGIQIGGARSARGVVGTWFDKDYDPHGPCGPTAFWKISDRDAKADDKQFLLHDFLPIGGSSKTEDH